MNQLEDLEDVNYEISKKFGCIRRCENMTDKEMWRTVFIYFILLIIVFGFWYFSPSSVLTTERIVSTNDESAHSLKKDKITLNLNVHDISKQNMFISLQLSVIQNGYFITNKNINQDNNNKDNLNDNLEKTQNKQLVNGSIISLFPSLLHRNETIYKEYGDYQIIPILENNSTFLISLIFHEFLNNTNTYNLNLPTAKRTLKFDKSIHLSETFQVLRIPKINFDKVESQINLKFLDFNYSNKSNIDWSKQPERAILFQMHCWNPAYNTMSDILILPIFIFSSVSLIYLVFKHTDHYLNSNMYKLVDVDILTLFICSIPPSFLSIFFDDTYFIMKIRVFQNVLLFTASAAIGMTNLLLGKQVNEKASFCSLSPGIFFFIMSFSLIFINFERTFNYISTGSVIPVDFIYTGVSIAEHVVILLYIFAIVLINGSIVPEKKVEHFISFLMPILFVSVAFLTDIFIPTDITIETCFGMKIFAYESSAIFALFFAFLNWPIAIE